MSSSSIINKAMDGMAAYRPFRIKASSSQRDELVPEMLQKAYDELIANRKTLSYQDIQNHFDKNYADKNINVSCVFSNNIGEIAPILNEQTKRIQGFWALFRFDFLSEFRLTLKNKILILHEFSHLFKDIVKPNKNIRIHSDIQKIVESTKCEESTKPELYKSKINNFIESYDSFIYKKESPLLFNKNEFRKNLKTNINKLENEERIAFLKGYIMYTQSEIDAYSNSIKIVTKNTNESQLIKKILNFRTIKKMDGHRYRLNEKWTILKEEFSNAVVGRAYSSNLD